MRPLRALVHAGPRALVVRVTLLMPALWALGARGATVSISAATLVHTASPGEANDLRVAPDATVAGCTPAPAPVAGVLYCEHVTRVR
jgi:hypothetical protein